MNYLQFGAFIVYVCAVSTAGIACHRFLNPAGTYRNKALYLGEALLLGSILVIGEMLFLSLVHLYHGFCLWGVVLLNFAFLVSPSIRHGGGLLFKKGIKWDLPLAGFFVLVFIFLFRNLYFLVDVDSHSTYLYTQKLWLEHGTSLFAARALDMKIFVPQFNAVPYALGISLFPGEPLFPQLIVVFWTIIASLLVFGYVQNRFNRYYALAAVMLCLFNDHMFYSGANKSVIINSAVVALMFASAYNFWEARVRNDPFRFSLALIFLVQLIANKYQVLYFFILLFLVGVFIQDHLKKHLLSILKNKRWLAGIFLSLGICGLWYLKDFLATGSPVFPAFGYKLGWVNGMSSIFRKAIAGPLTIPQIIKFLSYLFIWPGINAAKIVWVTVSLFPVLFILGIKRKEFDRDFFNELCFWLGISVLFIIGICAMSFPDPRFYRYGIAVMAVASIFSLEFVFKYCFFLPQKFVTLVILIIALLGWRIMIYQAGAPAYPTIKQNLAVLSNKLHMEDLAKLYFPNNDIVAKEYRQDPEKFKSVAWDMEAQEGGMLSSYLSPPMKQVDIWYTTAVSWQSYPNADAIEKDLHDEGIDWVIFVHHKKLVFEPALEYAKSISQFNFHLDSLFYNYGFPKELSDIKY